MQGYDVADHIETSTFNISASYSEIQAHSASRRKHGSGAAATFFKSSSRAPPIHKADIIYPFQFYNMDTSCYMVQLECRRCRMDPRRFNVPISKHRY